MVNEKFPTVLIDNVPIKQFINGDGKLIVKIFTVHHGQGVYLEYEYLKLFYPNYKLIKQTLRKIKYGNKYIVSDILTFEINGIEKNIIFDISEFYENEDYEYEK